LLDLLDELLNLLRNLLDVPLNLLNEALHRRLYLLGDGRTGCDSVRTVACRSLVAMR
jgi:hypothetical protein